MGKLLVCLSFLGIVLLLNACTKTESDFTAPAPEFIIIKADVTDILVGSSVTFTVSSSRNNAVVTSGSKLYVNGLLISGNAYTFSQAGTVAVYASKDNLITNVLSIKVGANTSSTTGFVSRVLVEEYSGTWCGNCPAILYGVDLLHQQTDKAIVVNTHLFNSDPFITPQGNTLAANLGITGVPAGKINRTLNWNGPQYENVSQVTDQIMPKATLGLAISSTLSGNTVNATVIISYGQPLAGNAKLTVYLLEDKLSYTQRNYSSTLYAGQANIPNFEYHGIIRSILSDLSGDAVANNGVAVTKPYSMPLPSNVSATANARLVAFVTNDAGTVVNVQDAKLGTVKNLEIL